MFALWVRATLMRKPDYGILLTQVDDLQELNVIQHKIYFCSLIS
jgi:hypothetical protein